MGKRLFCVLYDTSTAMLRPYMDQSVSKVQGAGTLNLGSMVDSASVGIQSPTRVPNLKLATTVQARSRQEAETAKKSEFCLKQSL